MNFVSSPPTMTEPDAMLQEESDHRDRQVRRRLHHDDVTVLLDYVNENEKMASLVGRSNNRSLPRSSTNISRELGERIACESNVAPISPGNTPGNPMSPGEHDSIARICVPNLKVNVVDEIGGKILGKKYRNLAVREVCSMFPALSSSNVTTDKEHLLCLSHLVLRLIHLNNGMFGKDVGMAHRAREMCCEIVGRLPQRAFFQLLTRWARRRKLDFAKDAINTIVVLNSHFPGQTLANFLLNSRDFKIQPPNGKKQGSPVRVSFVRTPKHECIVDTVDREIQLMYCGIATTHNVFFSQVRMSSVRNEKTFRIPNTADSHDQRVPGNDLLRIVNHLVEQGVNDKQELFTSATENTSDLDGDEEGENNESKDLSDDTVLDETEDNEALQFTSCPQLGYHMPQSFRNRLWTNIRILRLGFELFRFVFGTQIVEQQLYGELGKFTNDKILQFLFLSTCQQNTRLRYMSVLAEIAFLFPELKSVEDRIYDGWVKQCVQPGSEHRLPTFTAHHCTFPVDQKCKQVIQCYNIVCLQTRPFRLRGRRLEQKNLVELKYQTTRFLVFHDWLKFESNVDIRRKVYEHLNIHNFNKRKRKPDANDVSRMSSFQGPTQSEFKNTVLLRNEIDDSLPTIQALIQPNRIHGNRSFIEKKFPGKPSEPNSISKNVQQPTGIVMANENKFPGETNTIHGKRSTIDNQFPGKQSGPNSISKNVQQQSGIVMPNENKCPWETNTIHGKRSITVDQFPGKQNGNTQEQQGGQLTEQTDAYENFLRQEHVPDGFRIPSINESRRNISSQLYIETRETVYCLETAPVEMYLATGLCRYPHWRSTIRKNCTTSFPGFGPQICNTVTTYIPPSVESFVDKASDVLSVIRSTSGIFKRNELKADLFQLLLFCSKHGEANGDRHSQSTTRAMHFGIKGELKQPGKDPLLYGSKYLRCLDSYTRENIKRSIANIIDFMWVSSNEIQKELREPPLGGNDFRNTVYASKVRNMFGAAHSQFESVTILHSLLSEQSGCRKHTDKFNDVVPPYLKTATVNVIAVDPNGDYHLIQVVCNFRKYVASLCGFHSVPRSIDEIVENIKQYHLYLNRGYQEKYRFQYSDFFGKPENMDAFYLNDTIASEYLSLAPGSSIRERIIRLPIGTSRVLSLSGFLAPVHKFVDELQYDKLIEILFFASFMSTPTAFNYCFREWSRKCLNERQRSERPFFGISGLMRKHFGSISSGIEFRFQPCNSSIEHVFGLESSEEGAKKLEKVADVLAEWIEFIDSFEGKEDSNDIPLGDVHAKMQTTICKIKEKVGCTSLDFSMFRLSIFTTLVSGIGLTEPGKHLHQFFFPVEGTAAYNHLMHPFASTMATDDDTHTWPQRSCPLSNIDQNMRLVAWKLGWKRYRRDYVEVHMCESLPGRYLNKKDIFFVGQNCFELNSLGIPCTQEYGNDIGWAAICREHIHRKKQEYKRQRQ